MKHSNDTIRNRTRDLLTCSAVPQPTAPPRAPSHTNTVCNFLVLNPLNAELNPICFFLALLGAQHFLHVSRIRVKSLTLRLLMSYIYIYIYIYNISCLRVNLIFPKRLTSKYVQVVDKQILTEFASSLYAKCTEKH